MVDGVPGEVTVLVQQRAAMVPVRGQGLVTILHLLLVGRRAKDKLNTHSRATLKHVQARISYLYHVYVIYKNGFMTF